MTGAEIPADVLFVEQEDGCSALIGEHAMLAMQATQCPVLVRLSPEGEWWVIAQGPPGVIHAHVIDPFESIVNGYATPWDAAIDGARDHARRWMYHEGNDQDRDLPQLLREVLDDFMTGFEQRTRLINDNREENPDAETTGTA